MKRPACLTSIRMAAICSLAILLGTSVAQPQHANAQRTFDRDMPMMRHNGEMEPGMVGRERALLMSRLQGHFQSVELFAPDGANVWLMDGTSGQGKFVNTGKSRVTVGMLIGEVYRIKVTGIPDRAGEEIFPSIEVINRLYTPGGMQAEFAVPVQLAKEDLQTSLEGGFITRVVYLEDPKTALPVQEVPNEQLVTDVNDFEDPLHVADRLGRPMVILRLGSRVPDIVLQEGERGFGYGAPPIKFYPKPVEQAEPLEEIQPTEESARQLDEPKRINEARRPAFPQVDPNLGGVVPRISGSPIDSSVTTESKLLPIGALPTE